MIVFTKLNVRTGRDNIATNTNHGINTFFQTENIKHSNIAISIDKVSHDTFGTQMYRENTSSQQIQ